MVGELRTPYFTDEWLTILEGDCREVLRGLPAESVNCVITSPPYFGLRDYGITPSVWGGDGHVHEWGATVVHRGQSPQRDHDASGGFGDTRGIEEWRSGSAFSVSQGSSCSCGAWSGVLGLEPTPELYVAHMVEVFREVRRVLRKDGTVWLNLGDSYAGSWSGNSMRPEGGAQRPGGPGFQPLDERVPARGGVVPKGLKPKDRIMVPARVALALQADGWWLRDEIVWAKPNPMPSSVTDRTTPAHEMVYLLTKSARYWYDAAAIAEPLAESSIARINQPTFDSQTGGPKDYGNGTNPNQSARKALENLKRRTPAGWNVNHDLPNNVGRYKQRETPIPGNGHHVLGFNDRWDESEDNGSAPGMRNRRSVWTVATQPYPNAHFATFPEALVEPMVKAGCPEGGVVLDCFAGSGTVGLVAQRLSRRAILVDLNAEYLRQCLTRNQAIPLGLLTEAG